MSLTWKDIAATVSVVVIAVFTLAVMNGFMENIDARYAIATFAVFLLAGLTGLATGTKLMMRHTWSSVVLYLLSASALIITVVNAVLNSEAWFVALSVNIGLIWIEYVALDLFSKAPSSHSNISARGV